MRGPAYTRIAAATGIDFAVLIVVIEIIQRAKDLPNAGEVAVHASNGLFATVALLYGLAAVAFFWFASTFAARCLELEGGSGRLSAAMNGSGAVIGGILALVTAAMWASHQTVSTDSAALATSIVDGPMIFFPAAVFVGASGIIGVRARGLPTFSRLMARLSVMLAAALIVLAVLMLYKDYAWVNDSLWLVFAAWTAIVSVIGIRRWANMDEPLEDEVDAFDDEPVPTVADHPQTKAKPVRARSTLRSRVESTPDEVEESTEPVDVTASARTRRKPMPKSSPSKPAPRKRAPARKAAPRSGDDDDIEEFLSE